jgi:hypothetical protein
LNFRPLWFYSELFLTQRRKGAETQRFSEPGRNDSSNIGKPSPCEVPAERRKMKRKQLARPHNTATALGLKLVPA